MAKSDRELVKKTLEGNRDAFGDLVERYSGLVHGVILHKVRRPDEVEDLVQDVFCKAYEDLGNLRDPGKFAPWLARIAVNKAQGWLRQLQTQQTYNQDDRVVGNQIAASGRAPDQMLETHETGGIVWEALDRLPPEYRQVSSFRLGICLHVAPNQAKPQTEHRFAI
jgi:RNA polymerase sigma factor (sigma-70 family)